jgi:hypothetical protein
MVELEGTIIKNTFMKEKLFIYQYKVNDTPQNSLKDSNANFKIKIKGIRVCSFTHSTLGVRMACQSSRMGTRMNRKRVNYSYESTQTKQLVG